MANTVARRRKPKQKAKAGKNYVERTKFAPAQRQARHLIKHKLQLVSSSVSPLDLPDADAAETMQMLINRTTLLWRAAAAEVDRLKPGLARDQTQAIDHELWRSWDEQGNTIIQANFWVEMEARLRHELGRITESAQKLGLSERRQRVAEAQLQLLGEALQAAAKAAGLSKDQTRQLGAHLRSELMVIEGRVTEDSQG